MQRRLTTPAMLAMALTLVAAGTACRDGGTNPPSAVVTTLAAVAATDDQTATVADAVPLAPSVTVLDQDGEPMSGVTVTFSVTAGGGSVTGATPRTNANGVATVGSWTLGATAGENRLVASAEGKTATFTATGTPDVPSIVLRVTGTDGQSATVGTAVALAPAVRVTDDHGNAIEGVDVTFAVVAGDGSVGGADQTTDANGVAAVGSWTLGTAAGLNELTATAEGLDALTFTATATAGAAASIAKDPTTDGQSAPVASSVAAPPSVTVTDANGNPVAGVTVTFAVTSGGGSITGATQTTSATGVASVGSWTLGTTAGENLLSATFDGATSVTFTATGTAGPATALNKVAGTDEQIGAAAEPLPLDPAVVVVDAYGNAVPGVEVTFAVAAGDGSITDSVQVSDASGIATIGSWTLGPYNELNELTASAAGLAAVTFVAAPDPCTVSPALAVGASFDGELMEWDCVLSSGKYFDFYTTSLAATTAVQFEMTSTAFDPYLQVFDAAGLNRAVNDNGASGSTAAVLRMLLPAGAWQPGATSASVGAQGAYRVSATQLGTNVTGCQAWWIVRGVTTAQTLSTSDCVISGGPWYKDVFYFYLHAGETITITMTSGTVNAHLVLFDDAGNLIREDDSSAGGTNARIVFTAPATGRYGINPGAHTGQTGAYTLEVK